MAFFNEDFSIERAVVDFDNKTECPVLHLDIIEKDGHHYYERRHDQMTSQEYYLILGMLAEIEEFIVPIFVKWYRNWRPNEMDEKQKNEYIDVFNPYVLVSDCDRF